MILFREALSLQKYLDKLKTTGKVISFVPTMGALHQGHLSLINEAKEVSDIAVVSIFVNPTQFNNKNDFDKYPITVSDDILKLEQGQCDILFLPSVEEMYPFGTKATVHYNLGNLEEVFEGRFRPGHFQGVCQVVDRLLNIVLPHQLFLGQKDYQQCKVIEKLINQLQLPTKLIVGKTQRELNGLAMSSRNARLNKIDKEHAVAIFKILNNIKQQFKNASFESLENESEQFLLNAGFSKVDYVSIADAKTLQPLTDYDPLNKHIALVAAFINDVRLIDNLLLEDE